MILSMTGYGEAQIQDGQHVYHVELRSVNNRYFKASVRLPEDLAFLELELESLLRARISRGTLTARLFLRDLSADAAHEINEAAVRHYVSRLRAAAADAGAGCVIDLAAIAQLPGVCQPHGFNDAQREHNWQVVERVALAALEKLLEMRRREGAALAADLLSHCNHVRQSVETIRALAPRVLGDYRDRLRNRIQLLIADSTVTLAADDLLKEVAIFADRSDISEELSRIDSHLDQFAAAAAAPEPAGRKLDFIAQELLRETNTIGSKAADRDISRLVIEMKSAIDRIKEQVQNVE